MPDDIKAKARELALQLLGPFFDQIRRSMEEARAAGMSEADIQRKIGEACEIVERESRGHTEDRIVDEMLLLLKEAALPSTKGPPGSH